MRQRNRRLDRSLLDPATWLALTPMAHAGKVALSQFRFVTGLFDHRAERSFGHRCNSPDKVLKPRPYRCS